MHSWQFPFWQTPSLRVKSRGGPPGEALLKWKSQNAGQRFQNVANRHAASAVQPVVKLRKLLAAPMPASATLCRDARPSLHRDAANHSCRDKSPISADNRPHRAGRSECAKHLQTDRHRSTLQLRRRSNSCGCEFAHCATRPATSETGAQPESLCSAPTICTTPSLVPFCKVRVTSGAPRSPSVALS